MPEFRIDPRLRPLIVPPQALGKVTDPMEKLVIGTLLFHGVVSWPGLKTIAEIINCSYDTASKAVKRLEGKGWLTIEHRTSEKGDRTTNRYTLKLPEDGGGVPVNCGDGVPVDSGRNKDKDLNNTSLRDGAPAKPEPDGDAVRHFLKRFDLACEYAIGHTPPREWGRDMKFAKDLLKRYGAEPLSRMVVEFVKYSKLKGYSITLTRFRACAEDTFQHMKQATVKAAENPRPLEWCPMCRSVTALGVIMPDGKHRITARINCGCKKPETGTSTTGQ